MLKPGDKVVMTDNYHFPYIKNAVPLTQPDTLHDEKEASQ